MPNIRPLFKWTGGKRKEIKTFEKYLPEFIKNNTEYTYIEPFFGGGAVYWYLNNQHKNIINDIDYDLVNFLKVVKSNNIDFISKIKEVEENIQEITELEKENSLDIKEAKTKRGEFYYYQRNLDRNDGLKDLSDVDRAVRFFIVNQLSFNGMRRFNKKGEFNIPYGNYKNLSNVNLLDSPEYLDLLSKTDIMNGDYASTINGHDNENTFIFLDPPYTRDFKEYSHGNSFGNEEQERLAKYLKSIKKAKWMMIINKDDFTTSLYDGYIKEIYSLKYGTNIKNRFSQDVQHLIICNY